MKFDYRREIFENINRIVNKFSVLNSIPRDFGVGMPLTPTEIHLVDGIGHHPGANVTELAEKKAVSPGAISQMVKNLEKKGLVQRYKDPENRRIVRLQLTGKGTIAFHQFQVFYLQMIEHFWEALPAMNEEELAFLFRFGKHAEGFIDGILTVDRTALLQEYKTCSPEKSQENT
jgi:DNA-binding MarR family transcriptional regulator